MHRFSMMHVTTKCGAATSAGTAADQVQLQSVLACEPLCMLLMITRLVVLRVAGVQQQ